MIPDYLKVLIQGLKEKTSKNEVIWQKSSETEFKVELQSGAITADKMWLSKKSTFMLEVCVYNNRGELADRIAVSQFDEADDYKFVDDFYIVVRRKYFKVEETIKGIIDEVQKNGVIGKEEELPF